MKILQVHNRYQLSGGEDVVVENEKRLLESKGHTVFQFIKDNKEISNYSYTKKIRLFNDSIFSKNSYTEIKEIIKKEKPDICHVHNYMPLISPAVFYACKDMKVPVVHTLHNYRMLCANAYLFREGKICEECIGKNLYHGVKYGCYRNSRIQTLTVALMIEKNKKKGTWQNKVDAYIALSEFSKKKFIQGELPNDKIFIKPNFVAIDPKISTNCENYFLYAGRLDEVKGIKVLIETIKQLPEFHFVIAGDGALINKIRDIQNTDYLGKLSRELLFEKIKNSIALIFPSLLYENMPMTIIEAFACGKPVIASNIGAMAEIIMNGKTGLLFKPGNAEDLAEKIKWAYEHKEEMRQMGLNARKVYEEKYTAEKNYEILMDIYQKAIENNKC